MDKSIRNELDSLLAEVKQALPECAAISDVEQFRARYLGKQGKVTQMLKRLGQLAPEQKKTLGQSINATKNDLLSLFSQRIQALKDEALQQQLSAEAVDVSLAGRGQSLGSLHPIRLTMQRIENFFVRMGFQVATGPEIEDEFHNFNALNIPPLHPARAMQDTFYFADGHLLRTHTSNVQIRAMQQHQPPLRLIAPGPTYRCDLDATHSPMFHQVEGLVVDKDINFAHMKHLLNTFMQDFFGTKIRTRFRASYFPFTEPSAEMDVSCVICGGKQSDCRMCKGTGWLEVLGCGMVHPNVFTAVDIDNERYTGFAFGMGIERLTMLRYHIPDLRLLFDNDLRLLQQFGTKD